MDSAAISGSAGRLNQRVAAHVAAGSHPSYTRMSACPASEHVTIDDSMIGGVHLIKEGTVASQGQSKSAVAQMTYSVDYFIQQPTLIDHYFRHSIKALGTQLTTHPFKSVAAPHDSANFTQLSKPFEKSRSVGASARGQAAERRLCCRLFSLFRARNAQGSPRLLKALQVCFVWKLIRVERNLLKCLVRGIWGLLLLYLGK